MVFFPLSGLRLQFPPTRGVSFPSRGQKQTLEVTCQLCLHGYFSSSSTLSFYSPHIQKSTLHTGHHRFLDNKQPYEGSTPLDNVHGKHKQPSSHTARAGESLWIPTETLLLDLASWLYVAARQAVYNQFDLSLPQIPYGPQKGICSITFQ